MKRLNITIKNFQKKIPINPKKIKQRILKALPPQRIKKISEINVCFVNDKKIEELNLRYRGRDVPTDVLVFDLSDSCKSPCADIIISTDTAIKNARIFKTTATYEISLYLIHGLLHLLGYDDSNRRKRQLMRKKEGELLKKYVYP